jgi:hypothetical protein
VKLYEPWVLSSVEGSKRGGISHPFATQMKSRAESLDADLDKLKVAFSEISRLASEVAVAEHLTKDSDEPQSAQ